jgi:hypothetical protein
MSLVTTVGVQDVLSHYFSPCVAIMGSVPAGAYQGIRVSSLLLQICETSPSVFVVKDEQSPSATEFHM